MATSSLPAALTQFLTILRADAGLTGVEVLDGPPVSDQSASEYVSIGWQPDSEESASFVQNFNGAGARTRDEDLLIACYLFTWSGDTDITVVRARLFELLAVIENALRATNAAPTKPTINGAVLWAHIVRGHLQQAQSSQGARAGLAFTIAAHARI
ncbi:hypothetical protein [Streptomyces neyagawaensis]|uniref:hypothetical protein n=1 Tax=Streptomyces neyagawaensis TaxID=42238 RepID=UPI0006E24F54|nr:hypothetical protein [Streptomyces neyagawaensis]MCL6733291.1 hypothetical protein [Streptomyces neyagawaensis]MDE1685093.1 hypothetical protein [Streptomyces neyagawaensis]